MDGLWKTYVLAGASDTLTTVMMRFALKLSACDR